MTFLLLAALGACAQPAGTVSAGGTSTAGVPTGSPTAAAPQSTLPLPSEPGQPGATPDAVNAAGCHTNLQVSEGSAGKAYCVQVGGTVTVSLHGSTGQLWRPVVVTGDALEPVAGGVPAIGATTTDTYRAARAGTTTLASSRPACPPAKPGNMACQAMETFTVTIQVR